jgi:hypothetical protein
MNEYPDWIKGKTPHTDKTAKVTKYRNVENKTVIVVSYGQYRNATLEGVFELVKPPATKLPGRILVRCSWFGVTPPTTYPQLDISKATKKQILENYTGVVVDNIGKHS